MSIVAELVHLLVFKTIGQCEETFYFAGWGKRTKSPLNNNLNRYGSHIQRLRPVPFTREKRQNFKNIKKQSLVFVVVRLKNDFESPLIELNNKH